jgi:hypothetical protein
VQPQQSGGGDYLKTLMDYIHLNPVRAKMVSSKQGLGLLDYRWSSLAQGYARKGQGSILDRGCLEGSITVMPRQLRIQ